MLPEEQIGDPTSDGCGLCLITLSGTSPRSAMKGMGAPSAAVIKLEGATGNACLPEAFQSSSSSLHHHLFAPQTLAHGAFTYRAPITFSGHLICEHSFNY
jgi:hypothetical protein|mmetsp:Transcript_3743/g.6022  ORF Transcript_3743/g.6022 Transcript_3743/m.6022 type:complete len:100 (+) Transcript_3743:2018-2317(+)